MALRLLRLSRIANLRKKLVERSNSNLVHLYIDCGRVAVYFAIAVHLISCGWYWLGDQVQGWTRDGHMEGADVYYSYFYACRWTIAQVSGRTDIEARKTLEYAYTCFTCVFGLIIMSVLISFIINTMIESGTLNRERLSRFRLLNAYLKRNHVSISFALRAKAALVTQQKATVNLEKEQEVLDILPRQLLTDLFWEVRSPMLTPHQLFQDLNLEFPRMVRRVCSDAVKMFNVQEDEQVFAKGDVCTRMFFVTAGQLIYIWKNPKRGATDQIKETPSHPSVFISEDQRVKPRQWVSEAALWIDWENRGDLSGAVRGTLLVVEASEFMNVVKLFRDARARSVLYARVFADRLNCTERWSDIMPQIREYAFPCEEVRQSQNEVKLSGSLTLIGK